MLCLVSLVLPAHLPAHLIVSLRLSSFNHEHHSTPFLSCFHRIPSFITVFLMVHHRRREGNRKRWFRDGLPSQTSLLGLEFHPSNSYDIIRMWGMNVFQVSFLSGPRNERRRRRLRLHQKEETNYMLKLNNFKRGSQKAIGAQLKKTVKFSTLKIHRWRKKNTELGKSHVYSFDVVIKKVGLCLCNFNSCLELLSVLRSYDRCCYC